MRAAAFEVWKWRPVADGTKHRGGKTVVIYSCRTGTMVDSTLLSRSSLLFCGSLKENLQNEIAPTCEYSCELYFLLATIWGRSIHDALMGCI